MNVLLYTSAVEQDKTDSEFLTTQVVEDICSSLSATEPESLFILVRLWC